MPWQDPTTNWQASDVVTAPDFNRIEGNILFLKDEYRVAGPESGRPAPGVPGRIFIATNAGRIWYDDGAKWILAAGEPKGTIKMWSGAIAQIPAGFALCDGGIYTAADGSQVTVPDLRDRFVVGAGRGYAVGETGGAAQVALTVDQLPPHAHTGSTDQAGEHTHSYDRPDYHPGYPYMTGGNSVEGSVQAQTGSAGRHAHPFTTNATGGGQPHENRPPYYALCFIYKL